VAGGNRRLVRAWPDRARANSRKAPPEAVTVMPRRPGGEWPCGEAGRIGQGCLHRHWKMAEWPPNGGNRAAARWRFQTRACNHRSSGDQVPLFGQCRSLGVSRYSASARCGQHGQSHTSDPRSTPNSCCLLQVVCHALEGLSLARRCYARYRSAVAELRAPGHLIAGLESRLAARMARAHSGCMWAAICPSADALARFAAPPFRHQRRSRFL